MVLVAFKKGVCTKKNQNLPINEFIKLCKKEPHSYICQEYYRDDYVKPYFDIDAKGDMLEKIYDDFGTKDNVKVRKKLINHLKKALGVIFKENKKIIWTDSSRKTKDGYKISFHFFVIGYKTQVTDLKRLCNKINEKLEWMKIFDTKVYNKHGYFRFANQYKEGQKHKIKLSSDNLEDYVIFNTNNDDILYENRINEYKNVSICNSDCYDYKPNANQYTLLEEMLDGLSKEYYDDYAMWRNICFALKSYSQRPKMLEIFHKFSSKSKKYNKNECDTLWRYSRAEGGITIASLIHICMEHKMKLAYKLLHRKTHYNLLHNVREISNLKIIDFESAYLTKEDMKTPIDILPKDVQDKIVLIKSPTGTAKSTYAKYIIENFKGTMDDFDKYEIISIVSRKTLGEFHTSLFNIKLYLNGKYSLNMAYQLDSIERIPDDHVKDGKYILILDEFSSLIMHFTNNMKKMSSMRIAQLEKFYNIVHNACMVIALDADINSACIKFLSRFATKEIELYNNTFESEKKCCVNKYSNKKIMIKKIIEIMEKNKNIFVCSNLKGKFEIEVLETVKEHFKDNKEVLKKIRPYSKDIGDRNDFKNPELLENYYVFCTPTIIYGLDLNYKSNVFGFYYGVGNQLNALECVQQLNRIRKPESMNIWVGKINHNVQYLSPESVKRHYESINNKMCTENNFRMFKHPNLAYAYLELLYDKTYQNGILQDLDFHIFDILGRKKHKIVKVDSKGTFKIPTIHKLKENYKKDVLQQFTKILLKEISNENIQRKEICEKRCLILGTEINNAKDDKLLRDLILDDKQFNCFLNFKLLMKGKDELKKILKNMNDFVEHKNKCDINKMIMIHELKEELDIKKSIDLIDFNDLNKKKYEESIEIKSIDIIKKTFRIRNKKEYKTYKNCHILLLNCMYSLLSSMMTTKKLKRNSKLLRIKIFNREILQKYLSLIKMR